MADLLSGVAQGLASAGIQQAFTNYNREKDFENYQEAQAQNFQYTQDAQRLAPIQTKLGMQAAGLNPAGMTNPTPASMPSAPLGAHASPSVNFSADNNLMADARLKNAEAEKTELQNDRTKGENEGAYQTYIDQLEDLTNAYRARGWTQQAQKLEEERNTLIELKSRGELNFNGGNLRGAVNAFSSVEAMQQRLTDTFDQLLKTETNFKMLINGQSVPLSKMPEVQRRLMLTQIANNVATNALLASQEKLTDAQKNEIVKLQSKLDQEIENLKSQKKLTDYQANSIYLADWKQLMEDGEFMDAVRAKVDETQKILLQQTGQIAGAVINARTGGKIAQSINTVGQSKGNSTTTTRSYHYDSNGKMKGYDVNQSQGENSMLKRSIPKWEDNLTW